LDHAPGDVISSTTQAEDDPETATDPGRPRRPRDGLATGLLIVPGVLWLVALFLAPLAIIGLFSFGSVDPTGAISFDRPGLGNYERALNPDYLTAFGRSIYYSLATTVLSLIIGYPVAYWISRYGGRRKILLLVLVMLPFWTSYLIRTYAWLIILRDDGVVNGLLMQTGLLDSPVEFIGADISVILGMTYGFLPFTILPLFVSIDRLDFNLVQAARDLYASGRGAFLNVTLPLTMPGIVAASLLTFIPALGDFVTPDMLGGAHTVTIAKIVQIIFTTGRDWPYGAALGFILMAITIAGTLIALRSLRREVIGTAN
jgi:spermidine/putrescine transport system permease protein